MISRGGSIDELRLSFKLNVWIRSRDSLSDYWLLKLELFREFLAELMEQLCLLSLTDGFFFL